MLKKRDIGGAVGAGSFRFDRFALDLRDRRLTCDGVPVELSARYLDALALLVGEAGSLVSKDRFMAEVWRGVPVTDEALTQCVRTLRRALGDDAASPRFIATVPKHGYRFVAPVAAGEPDAAPDAAPDGPRRWWPVMLRGGAGTIGGGLAGLLVGLGYGMSATAQSLQPGMGAVSVLLVLVCLGILAGLVAAIGIAFGIAAAEPARGGGWARGLLGGAAGGLVVGLAAKLIGLDAFSLLLGRSPGNITGAMEGALTGAAAGLAAWAGRGGTLRRCLTLAGLAGGATGATLPVLGGKLMGGSLDLLARGFAGSRFRLDAIGALFGERGFGPVSQVVTGAAEGAVFCAGVIGAMWLARAATEPL